METKIQNLLQLTPHEYEMKIIDTYINWCRKFQYNQEDAQRLLTSPALFSWWLTEYKKLERKFLAIAEPYKMYGCKEAFVKIYHQETVQIFNRYSKPLVYTAKRKRQHILGNPQYN